MALVLNEEQAMLKEAAAGFLTEKAGVAQLRELRDSGNEQGFSSDVWSEMAQMGWAGIAIPEEFGGLGYGYTGLGLVLEQAGLNFKTGDWGKLMVGAGYSVFDIAGRTPLFGDPDDFYGNTFVFDPVTENNVFAYNYHNIEAFAEWKIGNFLLFADYTVNQEVSENDTGYLFGFKYGSAKDKGQWDFTYFYERLEKDAFIGLVTDSDFGGGGTDARGHVLSGTYAFHKNWNFKATYFINQIKLASGDPDDYDRLQLDLNFKFD